MGRREGREGRWGEQQEGALAFLLISSGSVRLMLLRNTLCLSLRMYSISWGAAQGGRVSGRGRQRWVAVALALAGSDITASLTRE